MVELSIIISSYKRLPLFRRTLYGIAHRPPPIPYEVIIVDEESEESEDILHEVKLYSATFPFVFVKYSTDRFHQQTGIRKFFNNSASCMNVGFRQSRGNLIVQQGNEVIPWIDVYAHLINDHHMGAGMVFSTTYDMPPQYLDLLDRYGANLTLGLINQCRPWPLQSHNYRSDVTNYVSLTHRTVWETIGGYDERYVGGISAEDSDFVRRARAIGVSSKVSEGISVHQHHFGKTAYYSPPPSIITQEKWDEGVRNNRRIYDGWDGTHHNRQSGGWGESGIMDTIRNF